MMLTSLAVFGLTGRTATAQVMYAIDSSRALFTVDIATGAKTQIGTVSANAGTAAGLAYDPISQIMYLSSSTNDSLYSLNLTTFEATLIGAYGPTVVMHGLEFDTSTGTLYGASSTPNELYSINTTTGAATSIGSIGLTSFVNLGYDSDNDVMYATNSGTDSFYSINRATGAVTLIGPLNGPTNPNGLAFNSDNGILYLVDNSTDSFYSINLGTGAANLIGAMGTGNLLGLAYVPNPIPEPTSLALVGLGAAAVWMRRRRKACK
jgi:DNA-binding beta-propeller fold protein YncE